MHNSYIYTQTNVHAHTHIYIYIYVYIHITRMAPGSPSPAKHFFAHFCQLNLFASKHCVGLLPKRRTFAAFAAFAWTPNPPHFVFSYLVWHFVTAFVPSCLQQLPKLEEYVVQRHAPSDASSLEATWTLLPCTPNPPRPPLHGLIWTDWAKAHEASWAYLPTYCTTYVRSTVGR